MFAGVEMEGGVSDKVGLEKREISLLKYAYYKHVGSYRLIREAGERMRSALVHMGLRVVMPYIEIYGHWEQDEGKLETELIMALG